MGSSLPSIDRASFVRRLRPFYDEVEGKKARRERAECGEADFETLAERLHIHYQELCRWNARLSLVGPGAAHEIVERHYGEALAALPLMSCAPGDTLVDLGSGAGFPAIVLASARPDLRVYLVESREKKWAFLKSVTRRCGLSCRCLNARVGASIPQEFPERIDLITSRAVALSRSFFELVIGHSPEARFLLWQGDTPLDLPPGARITRSVHLANSQQRRILEISSSHGSKVR